MRQVLKHLSLIFGGAAVATGWCLLRELLPAAEDRAWFWIIGMAGTAAVLVGSGAAALAAEWRRKP
jgi:hypothetical protein